MEELINQTGANKDSLEIKNGREQLPPLGWGVVVKGRKRFYWSSGATVTQWKPAGRSWGYRGAVITTRDAI